MSRKYKFALIGCGAVAAMHAKAIEGLEKGELFGVYDSRKESAEKFAKKHGCKVFTTIEELLACTDVHIVDICTPSGLHAEYAIQAANAGKHVVVEKPLAITQAQLDGVVQAAEKNHTQVAVITQLRFTPSVMKAKKAIDEGRLGKILMADFKGKFYRSKEYYTQGGWRGTWAMDGGGALMNQGIHGIDIIQHLMGGVESVQALCRTQMHDIETEDSAYVLVEYKNGAIGAIHSTTAATPGYPREIEINGTKGTIKLEEDEITCWDVEGETESLGKTDSNAASDPMAFSHVYHQLQLAELLDALDKGRAPIVDVYEGKRPVEIILAAYESSKTGKRIELK